MPMQPIALLACAAALLCGGAAVAAAPEPRTLAVDLPDGSVAHVTYFGEVAPQVTVAMLPPQDPPEGVFYECYDAYGYFGYYSPCFRHRLGSRGKGPVELPPNAVVLESLPPQLVVPANAAPGSRYHYTVISTAPDGRVCTQRTEWRSRGRDREPLITRTDVGEGCVALMPPPVD
jgi:hypothetical protein